MNGGKNGLHHGDGECREESKTEYRGVNATDGKLAKRQEQKRQQCQFQYGYQKYGESRQKATDGEGERRDAHCKIAILNGDLGVLLEGVCGAGDGGEAEDLSGTVDAYVLQY